MTGVVCRFSVALTAHRAKSVFFAIDNPAIKCYVKKKNKNFLHFTVYRGRKFLRVF